MTYRLKPSMPFKRDVAMIVEADDPTWKLLPQMLPEVVGKSPVRFVTEFKKLFPGIIPCRFFREVKSILVSKKPGTRFAITCQLVEGKIHHVEEQSSNTIVSQEV